MIHKHSIEKLQPLNVNNRKTVEPGDLVRTTSDCATFGIIVAKMSYNATVLWTAAPAVIVSWEPTTGY